MSLVRLNLVRSELLRPATRTRGTGLAGRPIGEVLVARGALSPADLAKALTVQQREDTRLGEILTAREIVPEAELYAALAEQWQARRVDLVAEPPDPRLIDAVGAEACLAGRFVPWRRIGGATVIVTARPEEFAHTAAALPATLRPALLAVATERDVLDALVALRARRLVARAETRVPETESCRAWDGRRYRRRALAVLAVAATAMAAAPTAAFAALSLLAGLVLAANSTLKLAALWALAADRIGRRRTLVQTPSPTIARLPVVSLLVPLYRETAIAERLVTRLGRLSYPRELLDICLVTEDNDATTRATLSATQLPRWMRVIQVPEGTLRTKPRALNYALDFARGSIVGVYDAEDAPAPDQIRRVVERFHERGPEVACLQGVLDYYNARSNWMARCFTLEYAAWFRVVLPGLERLGFAVPLGGTTLFFRREALERLGGWDAHNVTEDADLGIRLARHGYRTELIDTVTEEEANCQAWPWVRQRSRWIKGYAMTWAVHMRDPARLWRELGPRRFWGVQLLFGGSLLAVFLAPVLWSYWLLMLGLPHPLSGYLPPVVGLAVTLYFFAGYLVNLLVLLIGASGRKHRHLMVWAPTAELYFPLATLAGLKALIEMVARPFYWDKTCHGIDDADAEAAWQEQQEQVLAAQPTAQPGRWWPPQRPALADPIGAIPPRAVPATAVAGTLRPAVIAAE